MFRQFARNGRWGSCPQCPCHDAANVYPEFCEHTASSVHNRTVGDLAEAWLNVAVPFVLVQKIDDLYSGVWEVQASLTDQSPPPGRLRLFRLFNDGLCYEALEDGEGEYEHVAALLGTHMRYLGQDIT